MGDLPGLPARNKSGQILRLDELLVKEIDGIAIWALQGLIRLLRRGRFEEPKVVKNLILKARKDVDNVLSFIEDRCELVSAKREFSYVLYEGYRVYCLAHGLKPIPQTRFATVMARYGVEKSRDTRAVTPRRHLFTGISYDSDIGKDDFLTCREHNWQIPGFMTDNPDDGKVPAADTTNIPALHKKPNKMV